MTTDFAYCPRITAEGRSLPTGQQAYEDDVIKVLASVYDKTWTATAVIDATLFHAQQRKLRVTIVPKPAGTALANAGPLNSEEAAPKDAVRYRGLSDDPATPKDERFETVTGKGKGGGSGATIEFDPKEKDAEKTIVHELLHALRDLRGQLNQIPTESVLFQYENEEEFFAMLIGNIFLSEKGRDDLRASHIVYQELTAAQKTSAGFLADTPYGKACRRLVNKFICDDFDVATTIRDHVPTNVKFNPIREYLLNTKKYPVE